MGDPGHHRRPPGRAPPHRHQLPRLRGAVDRPGPREGGAPRLSLDGARRLAGGLERIHGLFRFDKYPELINLNLDRSRLLKFFQIIYYHNDNVTFRCKI